MSVFAKNDKAFFNYNILETFEAGLILKGHEVKSIKQGKISIKGSYVKIIEGEPFLIGALVPPYQPSNVPKDYDPQRTRKLLLKKSELKYLIGKTSAGLTLVPLKIFSKNNLIKIEIALGRRKKKYDKREIIKKREIQKQIQRKLKKSSQGPFPTSLRLSVAGL